jgi:hypothetical protein
MYYIQWNSINYGNILRIMTADGFKATDLEMNIFSVKKLLASVINKHYDTNVKYNSK